MLYCPNFFWNVLQVWMTGKDVYLQMTWSWPDKTWNILCSYCLQWNTSQSKFRNHYFLFLLRFPYCPNFFWFGVVKKRQQLGSKIFIYVPSRQTTLNYYLSIYLYIYIYICVYTVCMCVYIYIYIYIIHTHTHTCFCNVQKFSVICISKKIKNVIIKNIIMYIFNS